MGDIKPGAIISSCCFSYCIVFRPNQADSKGRCLHTSVIIRQSFGHAGLLIGIFYIPLCNICGFVMTYSGKKIIAKIEIALVDFNVYSTVDIRLRKL